MALFCTTRAVALYPSANNEHYSLCDDEHAEYWYDSISKENIQCLRAALSEGGKQNASVKSSGEKSP